MTEIRCSKCGSVDFLWIRTRTLTTPGQLHRDGDQTTAYMDWRKEEETGDEADENAEWRCKKCGLVVAVGPKIEFDG